jgi:hypothetical protein
MPIKRTQATQAQSSTANTPGALRRRSTAAATPVPPSQQDASNSATQLDLQTQPTSNVLALPALDAPAINANEPALSYKIDFADKRSWFASADGGASKESINSDVIVGTPVDLALQISKAKERPGFDQRLRLAFYQPGLNGDLQLAEINCNAVNTDRDGLLYVTSSGRSLTGALLAISESEDDIEAFCQGARFRLRPGRGMGVFIEVDVAVGDRWVAMASPSNTNRVCKDAAGFHHQLALIKSRFRGCGKFFSAAAVIGELEAYDGEQRNYDFVEVPVASQD